MTTKAKLKVEPVEVEIGNLSGRVKIDDVVYEFNVTGSRNSGDGEGVLSYRVIFWKPGTAPEGIPGIVGPTKLKDILSEAVKRLVAGGGLAA